MTADSLGRVFLPIDPRLNIPDALEFNSKHNAKVPMYVFADEEGTKEISYLEFDRACHRVAKFVASTLQPKEPRAVVALMALTDTLLYQAVSIGIMKAGYIPFPISPRNTPAAVTNLLKKTSSHYMLTTQTTLQPLLDGIKSNLETDDTNYKLILQELPSLNDIFPRLTLETEDDPFTPYVLENRPTDLDIAMYLHSSGSTGLPKAIPQTHKVYSSWAAAPCTEFIRDYNPLLRIAGMHLPPFHTLGIFAQVIFPIYSCIAVSLYPPIVGHPDVLPLTPTPENVLLHIQRTRSNAIITIPSSLQVWAQEPKSVEVLRNMEFVAYAGGALAQKLGDFLVSSGVHLLQSYGGTEFGVTTHLRKRDEEDLQDWMYLKFGKQYKIHWEPQGDGTYECQFFTNPGHILAVENLPLVPGYATSDLFEPHRTKKHLWKIVGRLDDVIIHSTGEKTVPTPMEDVIMSSNYLMGAIMFGRNQDQPGILVEPKSSFAVNIDDEGQVSRFRNMIWPIIEEANEVAPAYSRIFKEMILITSSDKPLPRAGKGTIMRKLALQVYDAEIEALYATLEAVQSPGSINPPLSWNKGTIAKWIASHVQELNSGQQVYDSDDLFQHGFDSLSATILRRRLSAAVQFLEGKTKERALRGITQSTVYNYPSIEALSSYVANLINEEHHPVVSQNRVKAIEKMISKYSFKTKPQQANGPRIAIPPASVVLLTGSTGSIGSHVLEALLRDSRVTKVYTLNRTSKTGSIYARHYESFLDKDLDTTLLQSSKLTLLEADLSKANLGLSTNQYTDIQASIDTVIHAAWRLDFNLSLSSFESNILGSYNLIDLVRGSSRGNARFIFMSSIASVASWDSSLGPVPEEPILDSQYAVGNGYGESKYVVERILATSGVNSTSLRIGQVTGGLPNGAWATTDWVPMMVKSSIELGMLPVSEQVVAWIPMDTVVHSLMDLLWAEETYPLCLNIEHPRPVGWTQIMTLISEALENKRILPRGQLKFVSFEDWVSELERYCDSKEDTGKVPAAMIISFFNTLTECGISTTRPKGERGDSSTGSRGRFSLSKMQVVSPGLNNQPSLSSNDVNRWIDYWDNVNFFC